MPYSPNAVTMEARASIQEMWVNIIQLTRGKKKKCFYRIVLHRNRCCVLMNFCINKISKEFYINFLACGFSHHIQIVNSDPIPLFWYILGGSFYPGIIVDWYHLVFIQANKKSFSIQKFMNRMGFRDAWGYIRTSYSHGP